MQKQSLLILMMGAVLATGCASKSDPADGPLPIAEDAQVEVTNNNWLDMAVYAVNGGKRFRLGMVTTMGKKLFEVPSSLFASGGNLQLVANPIGARGSYVTEQVSIWPGQTVQFRIENNIGTSNVSVR
jgi:hypothetical protein